MIDISMIETALDSFEDDTGRLPTLAEGLDALMRAPVGIDHWRGPYLKRLPGDPWGSPYLYRPAQRGTGTGIVFSMGPDGRLGTFDDMSMTQPFENGERGPASWPATLPR
jgi:general secretion pathway protein G